MSYRSRIPKRRMLARQGNELASKVVVDLLAAVATASVSNYVCTLPNPDHDLCKAFANVSNEYAHEFQASSLNFGVWGGVALVVSLWEGL